MLSKTTIKVIPAVNLYVIDKEVASSVIELKKRKDPQYFNEVVRALETDSSRLAYFIAGLMVVDGSITKL